MIHIYIHGRVQGVGYRAWSVGTAQKMGLSGWVRNRQNGTVEIMADGPKENLELFLQFCKKGPLWANVTKVEPANECNGSIFPIEDGIFIQKPTI